MAKCGGVLPGEEKAIRNYSPPVGPKHMMNTGVGLRGGENCGPAGTQGKYDTRAREGGSPGNHGTIHRSGSQGRR